MYRFGIKTDYLNSDPGTRNTNDDFLHGREIVCSLKVVNDSEKRAVKHIEDFHGSLTVNDEKSESLLCWV